jgi:hypothetical protein
MEHEASFPDSEMEGAAVALPKPVARVLEALVLRALTKVVDCGIEAARQRRARERLEATPTVSQEQAMRERIVALEREVATLRAQRMGPAQPPAREAVTQASSEPSPRAASRS